METTKIVHWLKTWWHHSRTVPRLIFVMKNGSSGRNSSYVEWPRLMICLRGFREYVCETGGRYRVQEGQGLYFAPGTWISPVAGASFQSLGVHWEDAGLRLILREDDTFGPPREVWSIDRPASGERKLGSVISSVMARPSGPFIAEGILLTELGRLMDHLDAGHQPRTGRRRRLYLKMRAYLEEHFGESHSRESVALRFGISSGHLTRIFREEGHTGFNALLNELRLGEARKLLQSTSLSVQEVALQCGFSDAAYFSRIFKRRHGIVPSAR